jgi:restriction endonuclease S subunit
MSAAVLLRELASIYSGGTPSKAQSSYWTGDIPWVSPKDMSEDRIIDAQDHISQAAVDGSAARIVPTDSILVVVRSGILVRRLPVAITTKPVAFNQDIKAAVVDKSRCLPEYLFWYLRSRETAILAHGVKKGATVHSLSAGFLENLNVPLPPLAEQRRIVDILNRAASIRRLREQAHAKTREIIPALFVDMFGDPVTNPKKWPVTTIGELATYTRYGPRFHDRAYSDQGARILRTTDIGFDGSLKWRDAPRLTVSPAEIQRYALRPNTLLITRTGATIGKTALFKAADGPCIAGAYLIEVGLSDAVAPDYVLQLLLSRYGQAALSRGARAVAQPNINAPAIQTIKVPLPPKSLQLTFSSRLSEVGSIGNLADKSAEIASQLTRSLMHRCFT